MLQNVLYATSATALGGRDDRQHAWAANRGLDRDPDDQHVADGDGARVRRLRRNKYCPLALEHGLRADCVSRRIDDGRAGRRVNAFREVS